jgi:tetratricopeptide (TPR) repeat protein
MIESQQLTHTKHRVAQYYLNKLRTVEATYQRGHEHSSYGLKLFDQEWSQSQQWQSWVADNYQANRDVASLCVQYPLASADVLMLRQTPQERIKWLQSGLKAARFLQDVQAETNYLYLIAAAHNDAGEMLQAEDSAEEALAQAVTIQDRRTTAHAYQLLGNLYRLTGKFALARGHFNQSLKLFRKLDDRRQVGKALDGLGLVDWQTGQWESSYSMFTEALAIARETGQEVDICDALIDLSMPTDVLGERATAHALIEECIERCKAIGYHRVHASSINTLGLWSKRDNNQQKALDYFLEAITICRKSGIHWALSNYLSNAANSLMRLGQYHKALDYAEQTLTLAQAEGKPIPIVDSYLVRVKVYQGLGNLDLASQSLRDAIEVVSELDTPIPKSYVLQIAMSLWHEQGKLIQIAEWTGLLLSLPFSTPHESAALQVFREQIEPEIGPEAFINAFEKGKTLTLDAALQDALRTLDQATASV